MFQIIIIAIVLAIDCFSVSFATSSTQKISIKTTVLLASSFGIFQGMMYFFGSICNVSLMKYIERFDHWIAFTLLLFIGIKMIVEACSHKQKKDFINIQKFSTILILSIATSIDALAVGFSLIITKTQLLFSCLMVFLASFLLTILGIKTSKILQSIIKPKYAEILGGIVLIFIGSKILVDNLFF